MLIVFSDIQGIVHKEFVPPGETVNGKFYCEVLKRLREGIRRKRPEKWKNNNWFLHHDNVPAHTSLVVRQFLTSKNITVVVAMGFGPGMATTKRREWGYEYLDSLGSIAERCKRYAATVHLRH
jgi:hypothetical protein